MKKLLVALSIISLAACSNPSSTAVTAVDSLHTDSVKVDSLKVDTLK